MNQVTRDAIAYIVGKYISGKNPSSVYSYEQSKHLNISGDVSEDKIYVYDYRLNKHISGTGSNGAFNNLYHYGNNASITLKFNGNKFSGYDYHTNQHYSGNVNGNSVSLYDYETNKYYNYAV